MNPTGQPFGAPPSVAPRNEQVGLAAILMMVAAGLALAYGLFSLVSAATGVGSDPDTALAFVKDPALKEKMRELFAKSGGGSRVVGMIWPLIMVAANAFIIFASLKMKNFESYNLAMAAAVMSVIPCCFNSCCCITSMPVGIFALVLLMKPEVKASFTS